MELMLRYDSPAPDSDEGWEKYSTPIGCGWYGANLFGGVERDRIQITENAAVNPSHLGGLNSFADLYLNFPGGNVTGYRRTLDLSRSLATVRYENDGVWLEKQYFASYPDRALVIRVRSAEPVSFSVELKIAHLTEEPERKKDGVVTVDAPRIFMSGKMHAIGYRFAAVATVRSDGTVSNGDNVLCVNGATDTDIIFCGATNYELRPEVFLEDDPQKKLRDFDPMPQALQLAEATTAYTADELLQRHVEDYQTIFGRVSLSLGDEEIPGVPTDKLLEAYSKGSRSKYLEVLYFQFGRYLLISSSRPGTLPANLQGVWNCHDRSPWGSGYWHNINVQMNYWPAFVTSIPETFEAYQAFYEAFLPKTCQFASAFVRATVPENATDEPGACGWVIGTANYPYSVSGPGEHSGPGTGGLTSQLFYDRFAFSAKDDDLRKIALPALLSMAKFFLRVVRDYDGLYLSVFSASPEQILTSNGSWPPAYHHTVGCAFDQQMIYENAKNLLDCVSRVGEETLSEEDRAIVQAVRKQFDRYDPVIVGWSGQVKEFREEKYYGEYCEYRHRHISQLVGLYPGTSISRETPAWLDAAKVTLNLRSDFSTGWALAHRLNAWARTGDGNRAYRLFSNLLGTRTLPNLWDFHPPFQIDGNLGGVSGVAEMLVQSHEGVILPLPAIPDEWDSGEFKGLCARGGFSLDVRWENGCAKAVTVHSHAGKPCRIRYPGLSNAKFNFGHRVEDADTVCFDTEAGRSYEIRSIPPFVKRPHPVSLKATRQGELSWDFKGPVDIWRAADSSPVYEKLAGYVSGGTWRVRDDLYSRSETVTYKITRAGEGPLAEGARVTLNHSTQLQREQYRYLIRQLNLICGTAEATEYLGE